MSPLSVDVFGEKTRLPTTITKSIIIATKALPVLTKRSLILELHLLIPRQVSAAMKLKLPVGASVKRFEIMRATLWYPATAVPKQTAKAIVYKEKEMGRAAAIFSNTESSSNVFEIEVSPLPYQKATKCRLGILTDANGVLELYSAFGLNEAECKIGDVVSTNRSSRQNGDPMPKRKAKANHGRRSKDRKRNSFIGKENEKNSTRNQQRYDAAAVVGEAFGNTHFACRIALNSRIDFGQRPLNRVTVFWDNSASAKPTEEVKMLRCFRLQELFAAAGTETIELWAFSMGPPQQVGVYRSKSGFYDFFRAIQEISYDGGTDMSMLPRAMSKIASRRKPDAVIVFSDGMDNLGRNPNFADGSIELILFPVHCVADNDEINLDCLKSLAAALLRRLGHF
jgi:hypothetical protein